MRVGIYSPSFLQVYGGGEKYVGTIAEILAGENDVEFLVEQEPNIGELENRLGLKLAKIGFRAIRVSTHFLLKRNYSFSRITESYDLFINQEHFSCIPSKAKLSFSVQEVPPTKLNFPQYNRARALSYNIFLDPELKTYDKIVTNSNFTKKWIEEWYHRSADVLYPPVDTNQFIPLAKRNFVLSVGRFFAKGHSKKQFEMVKIFKELSRNGMRDWELHFVGSVENSAQDMAYLEICREEARGYPVYFHANASLNVLTKLYGRSKIFWCATGLGEDGYPDKMEHFGMSTLEAMSAGCVPIVICRRGQPEIVRNNVDGFCWNNVEEFKNLTLKGANDDALLMKMSESSVERSKYFGMDAFEGRVRKTFLMM